MRVITRQNLWHQGEVHPAGSLVELSDELASKLISDGAAEPMAEAEPAPPQKCEPVVCVPEPCVPEAPKKQVRRRKK